MALDLNSFFNNLKSYSIDANEESQTSSNNTLNVNDSLYGKNISDLTEEEKTQFYESKDYKEYNIKEQFFKENYSVNYQGKNVQEIFGLSGKTNRYSYNCFDFLETDHDDYMDIVDFSPEMQNTIARGESLLPTFKYLHEDLFMSLYQYNIDVLPPERMHIQSWMNRNILSQLINTPTFITLRKTCRCDLFNAGIGTEIIGKQAIEILEKELAKIKDLQQKKDALDKLIEQEEKIDSLSEEMNNMEELLEEMRISGQENSDEFESLQEQLNQNELTLNEARALAEQLSKDCDELVETTDDLVDNFTMQMDNSLTDATKEVHETSGYVQAWGLGEGSNVKVPFGMKKSVLERIRNSDKLKKFTDMIGKYKECAITEQKKKMKSSAIEIKSVKIGDKIEDALPSDKLNLCNNITKKDFYRRMTQGQLMSYDKEAQKQKNKGPIIVCIDQSGSMQGDKDMWAKALAVGILEVAQMQKREFACIPYDSRCRKTTIIHKDEISPEKIIGIAEERASGGTDFEAPLKEASKLIEDSNFKEADIVFITDGDCSVADNFSRKFKQLKEDKEFRTLGVLVDYGHNYRNTLQDFCDSITTVSQIADAKDANSEVNKMIFGSL
jgi:uncharacterized protein with von Willebrand factor type A (vWA) domain